MFKGFSLCSHVLAVVECNGDLKSFLDSVSGTCTPNLTAIANQGLPKGAGRKGGVPKRKRKSAVPVQSGSICPCLLKAKTAAQCLQAALLSFSINIPIFQYFACQYFSVFCIYDVCSLFSVVILSVFMVRIH